MFGASKFQIDPGKRHPGFNDVGTIVTSLAGPIISGLFGQSSANTQATAASQAAAVNQQASNQAIAAQQQAANQATALQRQIYQDAVKRQQPWLTAGQNALAQMAQGTKPGGAYMQPFTMADFQADPGYAFRMSEGMKALEQSAAARGGLLGGNMLRGAQQFGQGLASQEYQNAYDRYQQQKANQFNRLASLAGVGQTAVGALGSAGQNYAGNVGNIGMSTAGNVGNIGMNAAGTTGNALLAGAQARTSSLQGIGQALGGVNWGNVFGGGGAATPAGFNQAGPTTSLQGFASNPYGIYG